MYRNGRIISGTNDEWARRLTPLRSRQIGYNSTTKEFRNGDGTSLWAALAPATRPADANTTVRLATTANITIATALVTGQAIDGVTLVAGDLVLVKNQTNAEENGVYVAGTTPARATGYTTYDAHSGKMVLVSAGTANANRFYTCSSAIGGTLDTTDILWERDGLGVLDLDDVDALDVLPAVTPVVDTDLILIQRADGTLATVTAAVLKTYANA